MNKKGCMRIAGLAVMASAGCSTPTLNSSLDVIGCPKKGVPQTCTVIRDINSGGLYNISSAHPLPDPDQRLAVALRGKVSLNAVSHCSGTILNNISWSYTKMACPR